MSKETELFCLEGFPKANRANSNVGPPAQQPRPQGFLNLNCTNTPGFWLTWSPRWWRVLTKSFQMGPIYPNVQPTPLLHFPPEVVMGQRVKLRAQSLSDQTQYISVHARLSWLLLGWFHGLPNLTWSHYFAVTKKSASSPVYVGPEHASRYPTQKVIKCKERERGNLS